VKISFIINDLAKRNGTERAQVNLANALAACGEDVSIWSCFGRNHSKGFSLSHDVATHYELRKRLRFYLNYPWLMCAYGLFILRTRPDWIICTDTNQLIAALFAVFVPDVRLAVWEHFALSYSVTTVRGRLARFLAVRLASQIVVLTESDVDAYNRLYSPTGRVICIPNIVKIPQTKKTKRKNEVLAVGRLMPQKGFDLLLKAWTEVCTQIPDWTLCIVGEGPLRDVLVKQTANLGITNRIRFEPFSDVPFDLYAQCGIFVLSSRFEGLPYVLIEAMACGTPCVSFNCPNGPSTLIENGVNGLLVPAEQTSALADALVQLIQNAVLREQMGKSAKKIANLFSESQIAQLWLETLTEKEK
jgi:glycosyltransferase involved in cell wall biosynthesis